MPLFDLDDGIHFTQRSGATPEAAHDILKRTVADFGKRGYAVKYVDDQKPAGFKAIISDKEGTALKALVVVIDEGTTTKVTLDVTGKVFLGGLLGRMVSADTIKGRAESKLDEMLKENFAGQPSKRAPTKKAEPPKPATPPPTTTTATALPPGHPAHKAAPPPAPAAASGPRLSPSSGPLVSPFAQLLSRAGAVGVDEVRARVAAVAAADAESTVDAARLHRRLVDASRLLARGRGSDDEAAAVAVLARVGASEDGLAGLVVGSSGLAAAIAAFAAAAAVVDVVEGALNDASVADSLLQARLDEAFERRRASMTAHPPLSWSKVVEVKDAKDAGLIDVAETGILRERLFAR